MAVSQNEGYYYGGPNNKRFSYFGVYIRVLPNVVDGMEEIFHDPIFAGPPPTAPWHGHDRPVIGVWLLRFKF